MREFYAYVWRSSASRQIFLIVLAIIAAVMAMVPLELQRHIINTLAGREKAERLAWLCGAYLIAALSISGLKYLLNIKSAGLGESMILSLRQHIFSSSSPRRSDKALGETTKDKAGTFVAMIASEAEAVGKFVGDCISTPTVQAGTLLSVLGYMLYTEPLLGLVVLLIAVPQVFAVPMIQRRINTLVRERVVTVRRAGDLVVDNMQGAGGSSSSSLENEIGKAFEAIFEIRLRVFKLKFGLKLLVSGLQSGGVFLLLFVRRDYGSQWENRNRHRGGLYQRSRSCDRSLARVDCLRAINLRRQGPIRPDPGHLGSNTVKSTTAELQKSCRDTRSSRTGAGG
jgi:ABC-type multidrug transport system fused ATPase/permease subunit